MDTVEFDEEKNNGNSFQSPSSHQKPPSGLIAFLIRINIVKNAFQANILLVSLIIVFIISSLFVIRHFVLGSDVPKKVRFNYPPELVEQLQNLHTHQ